MSDHAETDTPLGELLDEALAAQGRKKRVRASIADTVAIAKHISNHGEVRYNDDESKEIWSYERGYTDERIAREYVPHLAAHHVTAVREAVYPDWEKRPAEMTVEERLDEMEARYVALYNRVDTDVYRRLNAIDREVDGPKIEERLAAIEDAFKTFNQRIIRIEESDARLDLARRFGVIERYSNELGQRVAAVETFVVARNGGIAP